MANISQRRNGLGGETIGFGDRQSDLVPGEEEGGYLAFTLSRDAHAAHDARPQLDGSQGSPSGKSTSPGSAGRTMPLG
jgi:hypothetical protein